MKTDIVLLLVVNLLQYGAILEWGAIVPLDHKGTGDQPWGAMIGVFCIVVLVIAGVSFVWAYLTLSKTCDKAFSLLWSLAAAAIAPFSMSLCMVVGFLFDLVLPGAVFLVMIPGLFLPFRWMVSAKRTTYLNLQTDRFD